MSAYIPEIVRNLVVLDIMCAFIGFQGTGDLRYMLVGVFATQSIHVFCKTVGMFDIAKEEADIIKMLYWEVFSNGFKHRVWHEWKISTLPDLIKNIIDQLDTITNLDIQNNFLEQFGAGEINPEKWKASKIKIFICVCLAFFNQ